MNSNTSELKNLRKTMRLVNGTEVLIRPIQPEDAEIEWEFVHNLSQESKYLRFMSALNDLTPKMVKYFTDLDLRQHMALIAVISRDHKDVEIAVGRYFKYPDKSGCEFAIVVDDKWHGHGIGYQIMKLLIANAKARHYEFMEGDIFSFNKTMLEMVQELGFKIKTDPDDASVCKARLKLN